MTAMKMITGRRDVLGTFALTVATGAIGLASAGAKPAAVESAFNTQIWSFKHPDFLAVSVTHGTAHLALYDQAMWDKYQLTKLAGGKFKTNTLIIEQEAAAAD